MSQILVEPCHTSLFVLKFQETICSYIVNYRDKGHKGKALKDKLWAAAIASTEHEFLEQMDEHKKLCPKYFA